MMCLARSRAGVSLVAAIPLLLTSCIGRVRTIPRGNHPGTPTLLEASKLQLVKSIGDFYDSVKSFSVTARIGASTGSVYKGKFTDYPESTGYIDFRKPEDIRVVLLAPLVGTTLAQMVSDGKTFKVSIPPNSRFFQGANDSPAVSPNKFENIRPEMFLSAMLVKPVDPETELTVKVDDVTEEYAYYQLAVLTKLPSGDIAPDRRVTFDRVNLLIVEQRQYAPDGSIVSLVRYGDWQTYGGIRFPSHIDISRPKEEIAVELTITKMDMNVPVTDAKFVLVKPEGYEMKTIGGAGGAPPEPPKGHR